MTEKGFTQTTPSPGRREESAEASGKVWLVGAGPSDPGLMTLKGRQVLAEAEVVVYDALVGAGILTMIPEQAEAINVGKRAGHHTLPQEEISALLAGKAKEGKRVVRLKGGDPFLFGRGGEEIETLLREKVPFEVVPGVTSALAVPAYQGIPVTHRDYVSSLHIITGHQRAGEPLKMDFDALVRTKGTLVFLMGVTALGEICRGLLRAGMEADTPAALLMRGTTAAQRRVAATVATLEAEVQRAGARMPAIIVVGQVCALADSFSWYEKQPLGGVKILLTRPRDRIGETAAALRREGAEVLEMPAIRTVPVKENRALTEALKELSSYAWIAFTSSAGVRCFFEAMAGQRLDHRALRDAKFAVIGPGTARELERQGFYADLMPEVYDALHLGKKLRAACICGDRVLIPRAREGSPELLEGLTKGEVSKSDGGRSRKFPQIDDIPVYDTVYETGRFAAVQAEIESGSFDYALFTSASTVRGLAAAAPGLDFPRVRAVCIGKQTAAAAEALGMQTFVARQATIASLVERVKELHAAEEK